jgi:hypothetical protein
MRIVTLSVLGSDGQSLSIGLPLRDKKRLEYFFRKLILYDDFGYTLLGNKPVSLSAYRQFSFSSDLIGIYSALLPPNIKMKLGWKAWKKYECYFNLKRFALWEEESPWIKNGSIILLANKEKFAEVYHQYQEDFQRVGSHVDLNRVHETPLMIKQLNGHEGLIGTILGYGRTNAWLYHSHDKCSEVPSLWEKEIEEGMTKQLGYPEFIADVHSNETKCLKEDYKKTREVILHTYEGKDFLETTLSLLIAP